MSNGLWLTSFINILTLFCFIIVVFQRSILSCKILPVGILLPGNVVCSQMHFGSIVVRVYSIARDSKRISNLKFVLCFLFDFLSFVICEIRFLPNARNCERGVHIVNGLKGNF